ncbi:hypothetical protein SNE40_000336 [Patella caerulea]|uniref:Uncharacterized protein n=1 Tax=Patella caerulea TaxID=87958 RepID=A0AAN8KA95_PATCE
MNRTSDLYQFLYGKQTIDLVNRSYFSDPKWNTTIVTPSDLEKVVLNARDMFVHAHHGRGVLNVSHFQMNYRKPLETCFTYNGQWKQKDLTPIMSNEDDTLVLYVDINQDHYAFTSLTAGMSLCIHPPDEPFDTKTPCTSLSPGHAYEVKLSVHDYTYLPDPYNSYQSMDCTTATKSSLKKILKYFYHYSYRGCLMECLTDKILEECGCITEHEIQNASSNYCSVTQREGCVSSVRNKFNTDTLYASNISGLCYCPRPCSNVLYDQDLSASFFPADSLIDYLKAGNFATGLEDARSNLMMIKISFKSLMLTHISHVPDVTLDDLVSRMGGLMGFYIGASVLTLLEVVDVIIRSVSTIIASYFSVEIVNNKVKPELNKTTVKDGMPNKS